MAERTIPLLTCQTVQPIIDFYSALGFEVTFEQKAPYAYVIVQRGEVELQFYGMKKFDPATSLQGCYVLTDDVDSMYQQFRSGLKGHYGRVPLRGIPRIGPLRDMSYGVRQFLMTDPGGNTIHIGTPNGTSQHHQPAPKETFSRAIHKAITFADSKQDLPVAARILDRALAVTDESPTPTQLVQLLVLRADVAQREGQSGLAEELLDRVQQIELTETERESIADDLRRAAELARSGGSVP